jgi:hypothetical protein
MRLAWLRTAYSAASYLAGVAYWARSVFARGDVDVIEYDPWESDRQWPWGNG